MKSWTHNILGNLFGKASGVLFPFIFTPVYVHWLGIEAYALVAFFASLTAMTYLLDMTFGATITRELAQARVELSGEADHMRDVARSLEFIYVGASAVLATILIASSSWIARHWLKVEALPLPLVSHVIAMMGVCIALQAPLTIYVGGLTGLERQNLCNGLAVIMNALRGVGALTAMWFIAPRANVFFAWQIVFGVIQLGSFAITFWRSMPHGTRAPCFSVPALRRIWRFTSGMAATGVVSFFLGQINSVLLSKMLPLPALGVFQIANRVNDGAAMLGIPVDVAALPRLAMHAGIGEEEALTRIYHEACQLIALLILPAATIVVMFSWGFINAWIGNSAIADQAGPVAAVFVIGTILNGLLAMPYRVTLAKGWSMYGFYQNLFAVFIFLPLLYFLIRERGMIGAAEAWLILNSAFLLIGAPIVHRQVLPGQFTTWLVEDVAIPAAATTAFALALRVLVPHHLPRWQFVGAMLAGWCGSVVVCGAVMRTTRGTALRLIRSIVGHLAVS